MGKHHPLRMGVVGLGHFAQAAILPAFKELDDVELCAIFSGSANKRATLGERYEVPIATDYDALEATLARDAVDAVYIALPPDLHAEFALRCARRGVHVLCEKPMAPSEAACRAMIRACSDARVKLMIGYRLHFEAANLTAIELAQSGRLGTPRYFSSTFSQQVRDGNIRVQPRPGAGPLWDLGVYCINAARYLFRAEPVEVAAMGFADRRDPRFAAIDEQVGAILRFPDERCASFVAGFGAHDRDRFELVCSDGAVTLEGSYEYVDEITMTIDDGGAPRLRRFPRRDQIAAEIAYFARCVRDDVDPEPSGYEGLADVRIIEAIERAARTGHVERIDPIEQVARPGLEQAIRIRPHGAPRLVDVESATR
jgi:predicted dehydrogenase